VHPLIQWQVLQKKAGLWPHPLAGVRLQAWGSLHLSCEPVSLKALGDGRQAYAYALSLQEPVNCPGPQSPGCQGPDLMGLVEADLPVLEKPVVSGLTQAGLWR